MGSPMTYSEKRDARGQIFQADVLNNARTVWHRTTKFDRITPVGEERIFRDHPFWDFPSIYAHTLWRRNTKFDVLTHMRSELGFRGSAATVPGAGLQHSAFPSIYAYILCRRTTNFDEVTHAGRGVYLGYPHRRRSRGDRGISPPLLGLGDNPHFLRFAGNNFCMLKVHML